VLAYDSGSVGYIDLQVNGGFGVDFSSTGPHGCEPANIALVQKEILKYGVTAFCPTIITSLPETYRTALARLPRTTGHKDAAELLGKDLFSSFICLSGCVLFNILLAFDVVKACTVRARSLVTTSMGRIRRSMFDRLPKAHQTSWTVTTISATWLW